MKRILLSASILLAVGAFIVLAGGASSGSAQGTYKIELDNAFGLVTGADFKVAGVAAGTISAINLDKKSLYAVVTINVTRSGFGQFHRNAFCQSRPESLIGEYYIDCNPGTSSSPVLKAGSTIPVTHTQSTIPADLVQNVMRLPYRQRFTLIVNELGAAAAARSDDLQAALRRAVPALTETDQLLNLLGNDSTTLQNLTTDSNHVITALANNSTQVERFIEMANRTATATATQDNNLRLSIQNLPPLLEQLRPAMAGLEKSVVANTPVLENLNASAGQLDRFFTNLPPFSHSAIPAIKSLGQASVTGKTAVEAALPTVKDLNNFAKPTPELAQNLAIVLSSLDTQSNAVERDPRSPGGKGFSGLQALLGYVFNQALAVNTYGPYGHVLAVDGFYNKMCSPYATPATVAMALKAYGPSYRQCYSWLGPSQPGVNTTDPSNPGAKPPDPGGEPPGQSRTSAATMAAATNGSSSPSGNQSSTGGSSTSSAPASSSAPSSNSSSANNIGQIVSRTAGQSSRSGVSTSQAQQLLNYLLAP
jgi:phospholipid/cholesterol/gamma-HCH transport system substrate-binding protein